MIGSINIHFHFFLSYLFLPFPNKCKYVKTRVDRNWSHNRFSLSFQHFPCHFKSFIHDFNVKYSPLWRAIISETIIIYLEPIYLTTLTTAEQQPLLILSSLLWNSRQIFSENKLKIHKCWILCPYLELQLVWKMYQNESKQACVTEVPVVAVTTYVISLLSIGTGI